LQSNTTVTSEKSQLITADLTADILRQNGHARRTARQMIAIVTKTQRFWCHGIYRS